MDTMLSKALREFTTGPLNQLIVNLGGQDGSQWEEELKRFLRKELCWSNGEVAQAPAPKPRTDLLELVSTILYAIPRTAVLGAILVTGYLGGAVATHVRIGEEGGAIVPFALAVLAWGGLFLRDKRVRALLPFRQDA